MINQELIIKHFDILLNNIDDITQFDVNGIMTKFGDFKHNIPEQKQNFVRICESVKRFGKTYGYFDFDEKRPGLYFLKENGIKAKELGGHLKFQKSLTNKPLDWYKIIGLILTVVFGLSTIYFSKKSYDLKENQSDIIIENDSLKVQVAYYKDSIAELKVQIELYRLKTSNDTLQTKSLNDLKTY